MKALLSTTLMLSAITLAGAVLAAVTLVAVVLATAAPGFAAEFGIPRDSVPPPGPYGGVAPNRLDAYDMHREFARQAEHDRIHIRLGDPVRWCGTYPVPRGLPVLCR
jgi:hypothetical protein